MRGGEGGGGDPFVGHDAVVAEGAAEMALVVAVPAPGRHGGVVHQAVARGGALERGGQALHQLEPECFFGV